jgi:hypothetical protein
MPVHDWTKVKAGIFHDFHHAWTEELKRALNGGILPRNYYALAEQYAGGFGPDVLTLQGTGNGDRGEEGMPPPSANGGILVAPPRARLFGETEMEFYLRKQKVVAVRHISDDRVIAVIEVVSPGNTSSRKAVRDFVDKAAEFLKKGVHLLIVDLHPATRNNPFGIHAAIWETISGEEPKAPLEKPLVLAAYERHLTTRAYVETVAVGDSLPSMPLFLEPGAHVEVPLEKTYESAFAAVPQRWRTVLAPC